MKQNLSFFLKKLARLKNIKASFGEDADKDWVTLFYISIIIFIFTIVWSINIFFRVSIVESSTNTDISSSELIDKKSLATLIEKYDKRRIELNIIKERFQNVVDPSL